MSKNRLKLNADKTQLAKLTVTQLHLTSSVVELDLTVTDLGVVLDNQLSMQAHAWQLSADLACISSVSCS